MPNFTFPATNFPQNPNSRRDSSYAMGIIDTNHPDCKPSDLILADGFGEEFSSSFRACLSPTTDSHQKVISGNKILISTGDVPRPKGGVKRTDMDEGNRIAFRTRTELEVMDDGFKWRKYGKKAIKNNPNPRNYYRCSSEGCNVKKRVERDREDSSYVITTYQGMHNHESPSAMYHNETTNPSTEWTLQCLHFPS